MQKIVYNQMPICSDDQVSFGISILYFGRISEASEASETSGRRPQITQNHTKSIKITQNHTQSTKSSKIVQNRPKALKIN